MSNLIFIFLFMPIALAIYYLDQDKIHRAYILLVESLVFYSYAATKYFAFMVLLTLFNTVFAFILSRLNTNQSKEDNSKENICQLEKAKLTQFQNQLLKAIVVVIGILLNLFPLFYYKYADFVMENVIGGFERNNLILPLGISFYAFKSISLLVDSYKGKISTLQQPLYASTYLSFFGQIESGPLSRYDDMFGNIDTCIDNIALGSRRFMIGIVKKVLLSYILGLVAKEIFSSELSITSTGYLWLGSISFSLQLFFDFSGYSDMAIGVSKMFGIHCPENFIFPYMANTISDFWRRWHATLGAWFRDYIYIPLGGSRRGKLRTILNLLIVWFLTGLWHGANLTFIFWGLSYFFFISFEKLLGISGNFQTKIVRRAYRIIVLLIVNFEWVIFNSTDLYTGLRFVKRMLVPTFNQVANARCFFLLKQYWVIYLVAIVYCTSAFSWIERKFENNYKMQMIYHVITSFAIVILFIWSVSFLVAGANNPFAYANF